MSKTPVDAVTRAEAIQMFRFGWKDGFYSIPAFVAEVGVLRDGYLAGYAAGQLRRQGLPDSKRFDLSYQDYEPGDHAFIWACRCLSSAKAA